LVIHSVAYVDGSRGRRPIAHRLSFVEMVVPYGDPNEPHYRKNAFDAGEDGLGKNAHSLKKVCLLLYPVSYKLNYIFFGRFDNNKNYHCRAVIVSALLNTLMHTLQTSLEVLKQLKIVYVCMKRIMEFYGSIRIGGQV
jgi:hypothetical protein